MKRSRIARITDKDGRITIPANAPCCVYDLGKDRLRLWKGAIVDGRNKIQCMGCKSVWHRQGVGIKWEIKE